MSEHSSSSDTSRILIVDDDELTAEMYSAHIEEAGLGSPKVCSDSRQVMPIISDHDISLVLLDLNMPYVSGQELLRRITEEAPEVSSVVITVDDRVDIAVECMKEGAFDFLPKPVDGARLVTAVRHVLRIRELEREVSSLSTHVGANDLQEPEKFSDIITKSTSMYRLFAYLEAIASSPKSVLIVGESGSGKELVARAVHEVSGRPGRFVAVNVSGLDDTMVSDTLFGHTRGAYTGAAAGRSGLIEQAKDGTLFLDEVGDMAVNAQLKLLRLLQEEEYYPLGSDNPRKSRVRIVAATNADLELRQREGEFRRDLYYRLIAHTVRVPPLRERPEDIPLLTDHFVREAAETLGRSVPSVPRVVYQQLSRYRFSGNVRELQSIVFDAVSVSKGPALDLFPLESATGMPLQPTPSSEHSLEDERAFRQNGTSGPDSGTGRSAGQGISGDERQPPSEESEESGDSGSNDDGPVRLGNRFPTLEEVEQYLVRKAFEQANGNQTRAAKLLGVSQSTLSRRLRDRS